MKKLHMQFHSTLLKKTKKTMFKTASIFIFFSTALFQQTTFAQSFLPSYEEFLKVKEQGKTSLTLKIENDSLLLKKDDGFFTSGNEIIVKTSMLQNQGITSYAWRLGQDLYTASDINIAPNRLSPLDHPYAGWLYLGMQKERTEQDGSGALFGFDVGCLGPCAGGEWTQTNLHKLLNQPLPQAWSAQLKQEWGVVAHAQWRPAIWQLNSDMDVATSYQARLGNIFTDASAQIKWRYGQISALPEQNSNHVFARAQLSVVAYNATLQGGYFNDQKLFISPKRIVPEIEFGYAYKTNTWGMSASIIRRGNEIKELSNAKATQNFAKLQFIYVID